MKLLLIAAVVVSLPSFAKIFLAPTCYTGALLTGQNEVRVALLMFDPDIQEKADGSIIYKVRYFKIGNQIIQGEGVSFTFNPGTILFNRNDDFIPYGNATYNLDIELKERKEFEFEGTYNFYQGKSMVGGFGKGGENLIVSGKLYLFATTVNCPLLLPEEPKVLSVP